MSHKVELRHCDTVGGKFRKIEVEWREISRKPALKVHTPLACNVVCDEEARDPSVEVLSDRRRKDIICVDVSTEIIY